MEARQTPCMLMAGDNISGKIVQLEITPSAEETYFSLFPSVTFKLSTRHVLPMDKKQGFLNIAFGNILHRILR